MGIGLGSLIQSTSTLMSLKKMKMTTRKKKMTKYLLPKFQLKEWFMELYLNIYRLKHPNSFSSKKKSMRVRKNMKRKSSLRKNQTKKKLLQANLCQPHYCKNQHHHQESEVFSNQFYKRVTLAQIGMFQTLKQI